MNHSEFPEALLATSVVEATCWMPSVHGQEVEMEQQTTDPLGADVAVSHILVVGDPARSRHNRPIGVPACV
jgi:hypothetical protein